MNSDLLIRDVQENFTRLYGKKPLLARSPGRVNIIGEHTDYNEGFVLPAAIDKAIYVGIAKREDNLIKLYSGEFDESYECRLEDIKPTSSWHTYILGAIGQLKKRSYEVQGLDLYFNGNVPIGAGLSSSAAVECATLYAINELFAFNISKIEMIKMAQKAEHEYAGVMSGIMDQFASMYGKKDQLIQLDCRSMEYKYIPLNLEGYKILLLNTNVKHSLSSSEYNTRRQQCEEGVAMISKYHPEVKSLRDADMSMLKSYVEPYNKLIFQRCKYVVEENERLLSACEHLINGEIKNLGKKMYETHEGLSKEYEVSCKELDFLVDAVKNNSSVMGARMMGGGFGGCTINIVKEESIESLIQDLTVKYKEAMSLELTPYIAQTEDGSSIINYQEK